MLYNLAAEELFLFCFNESKYIYFRLRAHTIHKYNNRNLLNHIDLKKYYKL